MYKILLFFTLFFVPFFAKAEIYFSEIAWMGTSDSANEEWIEIYNSGEETPLSGWKIFEAGGVTQVISLSGSISSGQHLLVCRTTPSVPSPLSGGCDVNGSFSGSGLNNAGENLTLVNSSGSVVDEINASSGWPAGDSFTKETMQKSGSSWVTGSPTPGAANITSSSGGENGTDEEEDEEDNNSEDGNDEEGSNTSSSSNKKDTKPSYTKRLVDIKVVDNTVPVGSPVKFYLDTRDLNGANITRGQFFWNMGDGTERYFSRNEKFEHIYDHEGTYVVTLKYYKTYFEGIEPDATDKITVTIGGSGVVISKIHLDGSVEIKNTTSGEIDLSRWVMRDNFGNSFTIPDETFILGNKSLTLNSKRTRFTNYSNSVTIFSPSGSFVSSKNKYENDTTSFKAGTVRSSGISYVNEVMAKELEDADDTIDLNEKLGANVLDSQKQKQPSFWMIAFVLMLAISSFAIYFIYKKEEREEVKDDFELID
ncbi:MAG: hypothetical protein QG580_383 [Patescibacteria group bacterium]|jgi:hypothetical protein|nr:hypothetical protein [Patescibacteria group bacterium]